MSIDDLRIVGRISIHAVGISRTIFARVWALTIPVVIAVVNDTISHPTAHDSIHFAALLTTSFFASTCSALANNTPNANIEFTDDCNFATVNAAVETAGLDLSSWFDATVDVEEEIEELCDSARDKNSNPRKGGCNCIHLMHVLSIMYST